MKAWVYGYFGHRNLGDEAILAAVLAAAPPAAHLRVLTDDPAVTAELHDIRCCQGPPLGDEGRRYRLGYWLRTGPRLLGDLLTDKACVYAAGGSIADHVPGCVVRLERRVRRLQALGCRVGLLAVGVDRLVNEADIRAAGRLVTETVDYCSVRDAASAANLLALGVPPLAFRQAADVVFALADDGISTLTAERTTSLSDARVGLNLRPLFANPRERGDDKRRRFAEYSAACEELAIALKAQVGRLDLVPLCPEDVTFLLPIARRAGLPLAPLGDRPREALAGMSGYDAFVGMRFHSVVFAALAAVPCLAVPYAPKVLSLANELGLPGEALAVGDGTEMVDRPLRPAVVAAELSALWARRQQVRQRQIELVARKRRLALADMHACWHTLSGLALEREAS